MTFALSNFTTDKNEFTRNFVGLQSNAKEFVKKYWNITWPSPTTTPSTSRSDQVLVTVEDPQEATRTLVSALEKTPVKKAKKSANRKMKSASQTPEGAELLSPEKLSKPNTLDETIEAHFIGKSPFYLIK